jgi:hypothetical protein
MPFSVIPKVTPKILRLINATLLSPITFMISVNMLIIKKEKGISISLMYTLAGIFALNTVTTNIKIITAILV